MRSLIYAALLLGAASAAQAQSPFANVQGDPSQVSVSGISSGAAMAVQYALAHSGKVTAVGSVAGPGYRCAHGSVYVAGACMGGWASADDEWRELLSAPNVDDPKSPTRRLRSAYVFQSEFDTVVRYASGKATYDLLHDKVGLAAVWDQGKAQNGSNHADHGFIAPDGSAPCPRGGASWVRHCESRSHVAEDLAGDMFAYFYGNGQKPARPAAPAAAPKPFSQDYFISKVSVEGALPNPYNYTRRAQFDLAPTGWVYVPPKCSQADTRCPVHVAFHGCAMSATDPAKPPPLVAEAGYQNWADVYGVIVLYPQLQHNGYTQRAFVGQFDNDMSCWDWWGYLTPDYANAKGPQMRVIDEMIAELTGQRTD